MAERVKVLNYLSTLLAIAPKAGNKIAAWFARPIVVLLRNDGVKTLTDLFNLMNVYSQRSFGQVVGLRPLRVGQIIAWLRSQQDGLPLTLRDGLDDPASKRALRTGAPAAQLVVPAPLERWRCPRSSSVAGYLPHLPAQYASSQRRPTSGEALAQPLQRAALDLAQLPQGSGAPLADDIVALIDAHAKDVLALARNV